MTTTGELTFVPNTAPLLNQRSIWLQAKEIAMPAALIAAAGIGVALPQGLTTAGRLSLFAFALAVILWSVTELNAAYVALSAMVLLTLTGGATQERLFDSLSSDVVWLMIGSFILGEAVQKTGLAQRLTAAILARAQTVRGVCWWLTTALIPLAFVIPSTSGRAAVAIPVFRIIARTVNDKRVTRALALLIPTVILVSTISSIIGAGSHLVANDLLHKMSGRSLSFGTWMLYGGPFGIAASYLSCWAITRLFLDQPILASGFRVKAAPSFGLSFAEKFTLVVSGAMMVLWLSEKLHHLEIATVTIAGAMLLTLPKYGVLKWKEALASVSWNLILFVGAALVLGKSLIEAGAAQWIINHLFSVTQLASLNSTPVVLIVLSLLTLTSHVYMTSHAARAAALVPALLYLGSNLSLNPVAVMFIGTVGMNYCLTFPVSSKALLMFQELDGETWQPKDLLRLSAALIPVHLLLMVVFYFGYWRWIGLHL